MSLEQTLERIATALEEIVKTTIATQIRLTSPLFVAVPDGGRPAGEIIPAAGVATAALPPLPGTPLTLPRGRGRPRNPEAPAAPVAAAPVAQTAPAADPFAEAAAAEAPKLTEGDVRLVLQALKDRIGSTAPVFKLLKEVGGVDTLPKLTADKYAAIIVAAKKL